TVVNAFTRSHPPVILRLRNCSERLYEVTSPVILRLRNCSERLYEVTSPCSTVNGEPFNRRR
ncbi:hypothetical protein BaRGS_00010324, partial [Batillaria attramentaria]